MISFFTFAFFAISAAFLAVRWRCSFAIDFSFCEKEPSAIRMSEFFAIETAFLFGAVSKMKVIFLPFSK